MADIYSTNRNLFIKKYEKDKLVLLASIATKEIKIMEFEEQMNKIKSAINEDKKQIEFLDFNISQQLDLIEKEKEDIKNSDCH